MNMLDTQCSSSARVCHGDNHRQDGLLTSDDESPRRSYFMYNIAATTTVCEQRNKWNEVVTIAGIEVEVKLDTGTEVSVLPLKIILKTIF